MMLTQHNGFSQITSWRRAAVLVMAIISFSPTSAPNAEASRIELQAPAQLHKGVGDVDLAMLFGTSTLLTEQKLPKGITVRVWLFNSKDGECAQGEDIGNAARTCPREALLVSVYWDLADVSQFTLWHSDARLWWKLSEDPPRAEGDSNRFVLNIDACEASEAVDGGSVNPSAEDGWHYVPYRLEINAIDQMSFVRLRPVGRPKACDETG